MGFEMLWHREDQRRKEECLTLIGVTSEGGIHVWEHNTCLNLLRSDAARLQRVRKPQL